MKESLALLLLAVFSVRTSTSVHAAFLKTTKQVFASSRETGAGAATSIYNNYLKLETKELRPGSERQLYIVPMESSTGTIESTSNAIGSTSQHILEAEVFADLAHLILDVATIFAPDTIVFRLFVLCGRIFSILSDYIPDEAMTVDEIFFQSSMLTLASYNFVKIFVPLILSASQKVSFQDRRIYSSLFRSVGFTWFQFKFLVSNGSFEWIDIQHNSTLIETKENLLITYRGPVTSKIRENPSIQQDSKVYGQRNGRYSHEIIGDLSSIKELVDGYGLDFKQKAIFEKSDPQILTTENGRVSLLRINTERLLLSARKDPRIDSATKKLLFKAVLSVYEAAANE